MRHRSQERVVGLLIALLIFALLITLSFQRSTAQSHTLESLLKAPSEDPLLLDEFTPIQVFHKWKQTKHSKFIVANYSCPRQAGNLLLDLVSALVQAIVTNRSLAYEYIAEEYWRGQNTPQECEKVLKTAKWLPSWQQLQNDYQLKKYSNASIVTKYDVHTIRQRLDRGENLGIDQSQDIVVHTTPLWGLASHFDVWQGLLKLNDTYVSRYLAQAYGSDYNSTTAALLSEQGTAFMYGFLFLELFQLAPALLESTRDQVLIHNDVLGDPNAFSVAIHSRHVEPQDDGSDVTEQTHCIDMALLAAKEKHASRCKIYLAADRPATLRGVQEYIQRNTTCEMIVARHEQQVVPEQTSGDAAEHGPFAGAGMFQDLVVTSLQAQDYMIGHTRSSSALFAILVEYQRRVRYFRTTSWVDILRRKPRYLLYNDSSFVRYGLCERLKPKKRRWRLSVILPILTALACAAMTLSRQAATIHRWARHLSNIRFHKE